MTNKTPNRDQLAALYRFRAAHGRCWRETLRDCWIVSRYTTDESADDRALLQQVRNVFGPSWLVRAQDIRAHHEK